MRASLSFAAVIACLAIRAIAAAALPDADVPGVVVARATEERRPYFPTIERLGNGHLLVAYSDSPSHVSPLGRISLVKSIDGGRNWSSPRVVIDTPDDDRDPSIARTSSGALLLSFFTYRDGRATGVYVARSSDGGDTWSPSAAIGTTLSTAATSAKIVELDNHELLIPIYGAAVAGGRARSAIVRSTDDGRTWPIASETTLVADPAVDFEEPAVLPIATHHLLAIARTDTSGGAVFRESFDRGRTWSGPVSTGMGAHASDLLFVETRSSGGPTVVHSWGDWSGRYGEGRPTMLQAWDPGRGFLRTPIVVYHGHCQWGDESYPSSVMVDADTVLTVFYDACAGIIGGRWTKLAELTGVPPRPIQ